MTDTTTSDERDLIGCVIAGADPLDVAVTPEQFWHPLHETLWRTLCDIADSGRRCDPQTVAATLDRDTLAKLDGGPVWLVTVAEHSVKSNAATFAGKVRAHHARRELADIARGLLQRAENPDLDPEDLREAARQMLDRPAQHGDDTQTMADLVPEFIARAEAGNPPGLSLPWEDLDRWLHGLHPGRLYTVGGRPGGGKALALDTPIPTPTGWTTMGEVRVGDYVIGADGLPTRVVAATEVMHGRPCHEVVFSDGERIVADAQHQWVTETRSARRAKTPPAGRTPNPDSPYSHNQKWKSEVESVKTTAEIAATLRVGSDNRRNHSVRTCEAWDLPAADLPLDPYLLGAWLGDGTSRHANLTCSEMDRDHWVREIAALGFIPTPRPSNGNSWVIGITCEPGPGRQSRSMGGKLRSLNLLRNKHIPGVYLRGSREQRLALIQGLIDTDGSVSADGKVTFEVCSERLANGMMELVRSMGWVATMNTKRVQGATEETSTCYRVGFTPTLPVARLTRKAERQTLKRRLSARYIESASEVESVPVRCIQVEAEDHLYLAGRSCIPTHNSVMLANVATHFAAVHQTPVWFATLEMPAHELVGRIASATTRVAQTNLLTGQLTETDWERIGRHTLAMTEMPLHISDDSGHTLRSIRTGARNLKRKHGLGLICVDYLQLVNPDDRRLSRQQQIGELTRGLKRMAKELEVPVVTASQLRRPADRSDKRPTLADLRESGDIEADSDAVILLHTEDEQQPWDLEAIVAKNRSGPKGPIKLQFDTTRAHITDTDHWRNAS